MKFNRSVFQISLFFSFHRSPACLQMKQITHCYISYRPNYFSSFLFIGNPFLRPEESRQYDVSFKSPAPMGFFYTNLYYHDLKDVIEWYDDDEGDGGDDVEQGTGQDAGRVGTAQDPLQQSPQVQQSQSGSSSGAFGMFSPSLQRAQQWSNAGFVAATQVVRAQLLALVQWCVNVRVVNRTSVAMGPCV